ncbi:MAG: hypothetical protein GY765_36695, partial [bacterium]|nr:hypothetical protein [bacterium]
PVLFTEQACAELFKQMLVPHFSGHRPMISSTPGMAESLFKSKLLRRLNRRITHRDISISDDPTLAFFNKKPLIGSYPVDDQGVAAQPIKLVEKGILKNLLMSRRPNKKIANSNGHARATMTGKPRVHSSNLVVSAHKGKTYKQLKKRLLELCREQRQPFGLIVKSVDNPVFTGIDKDNQSVGRVMTDPVIVTRVYVEDGREELVRGLSFGDIDVRYFREIVEVGNDAYLYHCLLPDTIWMLYTSESGTGVPGSLVVPSVLFEELDFSAHKGKRRNPPIMNHPFFAKKKNK